MGRRLRIFEPGAFYHLTSRGNNGEAIVRDDLDCLDFLRWLSRIVSAPTPSRRSSGLRAPDGLRVEGGGLRFTFRGDSVRGWCADAPRRLVECAPHIRSARDV